MSPLSPLRLAALLARLRLRSSWNAFRRGPRARTTRAAGLIGLLAPVAWVGLFATAIGVIGENGGPALQGAALALVAGTIVLSNLAGKIASGEAVVGTGGEAEFLLAHPVSLPSLVLARSLAGVVTDVFGALFLLPILLAAAVVWHLGPVAVLLAIVISVAAQVGVSGLAQAAQILIVHKVAPRRRRPAWALLAVLAALGMASLWMLGSTVVRDPRAVARVLGPLAGLLQHSPAGALVAPLVAWRAGDGLLALRALAMVLGLAAAGVLAGWGVARVCTRRGWEQAGAPWAEASRFAPASAGARPLGLYGKDWRLLRRDPGRLLTVVALPALFLGIFVFGSAGWSWSTEGPGRMALVAYSLAAYGATFGPFRHMEAERHAFWILMSVPRPLGRILAWKAAFWASVLGGVAAVVYFALLLLAGQPLSAEAWQDALLAVGGAVAAAFLAVALAAGAADLSDDRRNAVGLGSAYVFMLVAGLFNMVVLEHGLWRARALLLYLLANLVAWTAGVHRAEEAFDPESQRRRAVSASAGAVMAVLLLSGVRASATAAGALGAGAAAPLVGLVSAVLLGVLAALHLASRGGRGAAPRPRDVGVGALAGLAGALAIHLAGAGPVLPAGAAPVIGLLAAAASEELIVRGMLQAGLEDELRGSPRARRLLAAGAATLAAWAVSAAPLSLAGLLAAVLPAASRAATGRLLPALLTRVVLVLLPSLLAGR
jgi:hypothetical protein